MQTHGGVSFLRICIPRPAKAILTRIDLLGDHCRQDWFPFWVLGVPLFVYLELWGVPIEFQTLVVLSCDVPALKLIVSWVLFVSDVEYILGKGVILIPSLDVHRLNVRSIRSLFSWHTQLHISLMDSADSLRLAKRHGGT